MRLYFLEDPRFLPEIDLFNSVQQCCVVTFIGRGLGERLNILRKTRTAVTRAGVNEVITNSGVRADAEPYVFYVGTKSYERALDQRYER